MFVRRRASETLTAVELQHGDVLAFTRLDGETVEIAVLDSGAEIMTTTLTTPGLPENGAMTTYRFWADLQVDDVAHRLEREVGTQASFYEPWLIAGLHVWLDAVDAIFNGIVIERHAPCRLQANAMYKQPKRRDVRLALQDATARICPEPVRPWCPLPPGGLRIADCYRGEDCWLGAYDGASAHGGLDINHPAGTPLYAPIDLDDQFLYHAVVDGANNNRWRGQRRWGTGDIWTLISCHMVRQTVPAHTPLAAGTHYAEGAGVHVGVHEHSHFGFEIYTHGELIRLDPWILFWQMYRDG